MDSVETRLQTLWDHHQIRELLARYCTGCDRADTARMASTYCVESWDDHGPDKAPGPAFSALMTRRVAEDAEMCSHQLGQSTISVDGDTAAAETYFIATVRETRREGQPMLNQLGGRYIDTLLREEGEWRIKDRICVRDWSISQAIDKDWLRSAGFVEGRPESGDPVYARMGLIHGGLAAES